MSLRNNLAPSPPMGWNSWDCFGTSVTEAEVRANALFMANNLLQFGWDTIVVDIQWYEPDAKSGGYREFAPLIMDDYGRLLPATNRFPSAKDGEGFKPLAVYIHSLGLKFGIHIMRGIPRQAVEKNLPIWNSKFSAQDVADTSNPCPWNTDMFGLDMSKAGAQDYINSLVELYAAWRVDFIKADDMLFPYHAQEIEGYSQALHHASREIILSLSPGVDLSIEHAEHLKAHCELWRISADFWDRWEDLKAQFALCAQWSPHIGAGHWPDADMLPIGHIGIRAERGIDRKSLLSPDEQISLMSLWCIFRSPLMLGCDLPTSDSATMALISNPEVLEVNQASRNNHQFSRNNELIIWQAEAINGDCFLACFNIGDEANSIEIKLSEHGFSENCRIRDLWQGSDLGIFATNFTVPLNAHGAALYRLSQSKN